MYNEIIFTDANNRKINYKDFTFSDDAQHIQIYEDLTKCSFPLKIILNGNSSSFGIAKLFILKTAIDSIVSEVDINVYIPYLPYAREDRNCSKGQSFALSYFAKSFNLFFPKSHLFVLDVHNTGSLALFNSASSLDMLSLLKNEDRLIKLMNVNLTGLICPDKGAISRVEKIASYLNKDCGEYIVYCDKKRDMNTGKILSFSASEIKRTFSDLILFDDICDGGGTFIASAKEIKKQNPDIKLHLCVTHGIFSKGCTELKSVFDNIYCFNSVNSELPEEIKELNGWRSQFLEIV